MAVISAEDAKANISANIRRILDARGMTPYTLAKMTGKPQNSIYRLVRGENEPGAVMLAQIAEALDVSIDRLFAYPEKRKNSA